MTRKYNKATETTLGERIAETGPRPTPSLLDPDNTGGRKRKQQTLPPCVDKGGFFYVKTEHNEETGLFCSGHRAGNGDLRCHQTAVPAQENSAVQIMDTSFSMLCICLVGYWYGLKTGLTAAVAYGILQFITGPYVVHPAQVLLDYPLAFGALGLSGLFSNAKNGLVKGYIVGVLGRYVMHMISGLIFYTAYTGDFAGNAAAIWASTLYNMSYIFPEAILTLILLAIPAVRKGLDSVKRMAVSA